MFWNFVFELFFGTCIFFPNFFGTYLEPCEFIVMALGPQDEDLVAALAAALSGEADGLWDPAGFAADGIPYVDVPNGLDTISKVPAAGCTEIAAYDACCERSQEQSPGTAAVAGDFDRRGFMSSDPVGTPTMLAKEIADRSHSMLATSGS